MPICKVVYTTSTETSRRNQYIALFQRKRERERKRETKRDKEREKEREKKRERKRERKGEKKRQKEEQGSFEHCTLHEVDSGVA